MLTEIDKMKLAAQLERLQKHFFATTYDFSYPSLLDLCHSIRYWFEMKDFITNLNSNQVFRSVKPSKKLSREINDSFHVTTFFSSKVKTFVKNEVKTLKPEKISPVWFKGSYCISAPICFAHDGSREVTDFTFVGKFLEKEKHYLLESSVEKKMSFKQWVEAEAVRVGNPSLIISREHLAKRVANSYDASHPSSFVKDGKEGKYEKPVQLLMEVRFGGLPLPYFNMLDIAASILDGMPKLLQLKN